MKKLNLIVTLLMFVFISYAQSTDQCVNCENSTILGENSSVIGFGNEINGNNSVVIGAQSKALSNGSIVIGYDVRTTASNAFIIGNGYGKTGIINNISNSLMIGFNSEKPTLFVSSSNGYESTGKLGIGNVTELEAKLHIKGDDIGKYDASLFIESSNPEKTSIIYLSDKSHHISVSGLGGVMSFSSMQGYNFSSGNVGIGTSNPSARLDVNGTLEINGEANFTQNLIVEGESHFNGIVLDNESSISGAKWIEGLNLLRFSGNGGTEDFRIDADGEATFHNNLVVEGESHLNGIILNNDADITGADQIVGFNDLRLSGDADGGVDLFISNDGKVGIGTNNPSSQLEVSGSFAVGTSSFKSIYMGSCNFSATLNYPISYIGFNIKSTGSNSWTTSSGGTNNGAALIYGNAFGDLVFAPIETTGNSNQSLDDDAVKSKVRMILRKDGLLKVKEVKIKADVWSDYVFYEDYNLRSLEEVEAYVKENKHLPEVPSEKEVLDEGINLGQTDALLLKKIEELTLYIIQQQKEINELKENIQK